MTINIQVVESGMHFNASGHAKLAAGEPITSDDLAPFKRAPMLEHCPAAEEKAPAEAPTDQETLTPAEERLLTELEALMRQTEELVRQAVSEPKPVIPPPRPVAQTYRPIPPARTQRPPYRSGWG